MANEVEIQGKTIDDLSEDEYEKTVHELVDVVMAHGIDPEFVFDMLIEAGVVFDQNVFDLTDEEVAANLREIADVVEDAEEDDDGEEDEPFDPIIERDPKAPKPGKSS